MHSEMILTDSFSQLVVFTDVLPNLEQCTRFCFVGSNLGDTDTDIYSTAPCVEVVRNWRGRGADAGGGPSGIENYHIGPGKAHVHETGWKFCVIKAGCNPTHTVTGKALQ